MEILLGLAKNDIEKKIAGSYLGKIWIFFQPVITILVMWGVFSLGFKTPSIENVPFVLWIGIGMVVWNFFSDTSIQMTNSLIEYSFLLKQTYFKNENVLKIKIISNSFIHLILNVLLLIIYFIYGGKFDFYLFQLLYYYICLVILTYSLGLLTSSLRVFIKDTNEIVVAILQLFFWYTPIFWNIDIVAPKYKWLFQINPISYIIEGYRDSYIFKMPFYEKLTETGIFIGTTLAIYVLGKFIFKRLKPQFNDML